MADIAPGGMRECEVETVTCTIGEPLHHPVGDLFGRADGDSVPVRPRHFGHQLAHRVSLLDRQAPQVRIPASGHLDLLDVGQCVGRDRLLEVQCPEINAGHICSEFDQSGLHVDVGGQLGSQSVSFGLGRADDRHEARQDTHVIGFAPALAEQFMDAPRECSG
jgi:hypothetical protein